MEQTKETREQIGEWGGRLEKWRTREKDLLNKTSDKVLGEELNLPPEEQKKAREQRQLAVCLQVVRIVISDPKRDEYFPSSRLLNRTAELLGKEEIKETVKTAASKRGKILPNEFLEQVPQALKEALVPAQKRRFYAEMREAEEKGDLKFALLMGTMALLAGRVSSEELYKPLRGMIGL